MTQRSAKITSSTCFYLTFSFVLLPFFLSPSHYAVSDFDKKSVKPKGPMKYYWRKREREEQRRGVRERKEGEKEKVLVDGRG